MEAFVYISLENPVESKSQNSSREGILPCIDYEVFIIDVFL